MVRVPNFSYVVEGKIAGSSHPGHADFLTEALTEFRDEGIRAVLTLTEQPLDPGPLRELDMASLHLPVQDFTAPTANQIDRAVEFLGVHGTDDSRVVVHCAVGYGRTGTVLACYLVSRGRTAEAAIETIRRLRPGSIEDPSQERAVEEYERQVRQEAASREPSPDGA